ncbi:MAG TPA: hypothetical protein PKO06_12895 [Candidatus Ozemobacteraceae bacterium]|nr:hypothetical protein [Candidatus Ozemobacteraceae bacterium]
MQVLDEVDDAKAQLNREQPNKNRYDKKYTTNQGVHGRPRGKPDQLTFSALT